MPGYTYGQQAQPTTAGHYLSAVSGALLRDAERLVDACVRLDRNPLGAAAFAGTSWPIERGRTAELLGFDGLLENTLDAVAAADYMLEALCAAGITACTLGRVSEDVFRWCANEVGFATLPDDLIDSSTIMPQKRNPVIVATVRAQARVVAGEVAGLLGAASVGYEASRDVTLAQGNVRDALALVEGMAEITREVIAGLHLQPDRMAAALSLGFSTATEVADALARQGSLPFRQAHQIVGSVVSRLLAEGKGPADLTPGLLDEACRAIAGRGLPLSPEQVQDALGARLAVERKALPGGPAPAEVRRLAAAQAARAATQRGRLDELERRWSAARDALTAAVQAVCRAGAGRRSAC
jgi:argininosuccinate lyase